jgi:cell division protein FtsL
MTMAAGRAARPRPNPEPRLEPARRLRAVAPVRRVPRLPFLLLTLGAILAAVLGLVALNVNVNQQAFELARLARENRAAEQRYGQLQAEVDRLKAPERIVRVATRRGMVPAGRPHVAAWPGGGGRRAGGENSPGAATSPAAPGAHQADGSDASTFVQDPFPIKPYLAQP